MITKKNIFHYLVYVLFALTFFCSIGLYAVKYAELSGNSDFLIPLLIKYGIVFAGTAILIVGYTLGIKYIPEKYIPKKFPVLSKNVELIIVGLCVILAGFVRLMAVANVLGHEIESEYYSYAQGISNALTDTSFVSLLYAKLCCAFYGMMEEPYLIYAFNGILQLGSVVLAYFMLKRAFKIRYAIATIVFLSFLPAYFSSITVISPDQLLCFLFVLFLYFLARICEMNKKGKINENYHIVYIVLLGIFAGVLCVFDIIGVSSVIVGICMLLMVTNKDAWLPIQKSRTQVLAFAGSAVIACLFLLYLIPIDSVNGIDGIVQFGQRFIPDGLSLVINVPIYKRPESVVLYILVQTAILAFIRNDDDYGLNFVIISDFAAIFTFVSFKGSDYAAVVDFMFCVLAVIGVFSLPDFILTKEEVAVSKEKKRNRERIKEEKQIKKDKNNGTLRLSLNPDNDNSEYQNVSFEDNKKKEEKTQVVSAPPEIPKELQEEKKAPVGEVVKKENKPLIPAEEVHPEPSEVKRNVVPSRREYKTAHVYKNEEEKAIHDSKLNEPVVTSVQTDAYLKEKPAASVQKEETAKNTGMIKNVLPTPKPHVSKELTFDIDPEGRELDYDIKDLKGKDFYDI